ncbi:MAG: hypothetical protein R2758_09790 [Bacteroidales bacterium]
MSQQASTNTSGIHQLAPVLTWGIWVKQPVWYTLPVALLSSWLLWLTARRDERCLSYFGEKYREYMKGTRILIPFIL